MSVNVKTYANYLQAAIKANATIAAYCTHVLNVDSADDADDQELINNHIGDNRYTIIIRDARISAQEQYGSSGTDVYYLQADILAAIKAGQNFDITNDITTPVMGAPYSSTGKSVQDLVSDIAAALKNNKLTGSYLDMGGNIIETEPSVDAGNSIHYVRTVHEGKRIS